MMGLLDDIIGNKPEPKLREPYPQSQAWQRLNNFEYRGELNFLRDLFYNGQWVEVHNDGNGAGVGATFTVPANRTFVWVAGNVQNASVSVKHFELLDDDVELESLDLNIGDSGKFVLPVHMFESTHVCKIENNSGNGDWHSSLYGYTEIETRTSFGNFLSST